MERLVINIPGKKSALVKQLLKELGVTIDNQPVEKNEKNATPNALTAETIDNARKGIGLGEPIKNIGDFVKSL